MVPDLAGQIARLAPWLPDALVPAPVRGRLERVAADLPDAWTWGCIECRLDGDPQVDLLACALDAHGDRARLAAAAPSSRLASIQPMIDAWVTPGSRLARMAMLWAEVDLPRDGVDLPPFAHLRLAPHHPTQATQPRVPNEEAMALVDDALPRMLGVPLAPASRAAVARALAVLPPSGRPMHVMATPARGTHDLKMDASLLRDEVIPWLDALDWPGDVADVLRVHRWFGEGRGRTSTQIVLGDDVRAPLAMEYYRPSLPSENGDWRRFMGHLVDEGVAAAEPAEAALGWIGRSVLQGDEWPLHVLRELEIKVVTDGRGQLRAKAYLSWLMRCQILGP